MGKQIVTDNVKFAILRCRDQHKIGCITLDSPPTLNAVSLSMVDAMQAQMDAWRAQKDIVCLLINGAGDKAFCAGGDIRAAYRAMKESPGSAPAAERFFCHEYKLDYSIHTYPKPIIIWGHGIVMGGGMGIFMGGDFRVVTETTRVAMPEITIALYPDVGASYFLNRTPGHSGRFLALTGAAINSADCRYLGLADHFIQHRHHGEIIRLLTQQCWSSQTTDNAAIIAELLSRFADASAAHLPPGNVETHRETIDALFAEPDAHRLIDNFLAFATDDPWLQRAQATLRAGSPLAALIIDRQLRQSRGLDLADVFKSELILSTNITRFTEFTEGIRALLIDKDKAPNWHFKNHHDVPAEFVAGFFTAPWQHNPLEEL